MSGQLKLRMWTSIAATVLTMFTIAPAGAQDRPRVPQEQAVLVVEGVVRQVFQSSRTTQTDYLVEIEVARCEGRRVPGPMVRTALPGPGDSVYVHIFQRPGRDDGYRQLPEERADIRAYLVPRDEGGWKGTYPDWFAPVSAAPTPGATEQPAEADVLAGLGMTTDAMDIRGKVALRVTSVERDGAARSAGLEVGDVIVGVNGKPFANAEQLDALARQGGPMTLVVVDVNTGRTAQVEVRAGVAGGLKPGPDRPAAEATANKPPDATRSLGISAEPVSIGLRTALKVVGVEPDSPAAKAGLEEGDVLVKANGAALTGPEQLAAALRKSGSVMTLTVRDVRSGRDVPVDVQLGGGAPTPSLPAEFDATIAGDGKGKLGIVTELAFFDDEAAVKITEVERGGLAERSGMQVGMFIVEANGKPVLHPNDLVDAERAATGPLRLTVVDPRSGKKSVVNINLGGGRRP